MELYIAGGCGEHGRNSFLLQEGNDSILVDCGNISDEENPYPKLNHNQIKSIKYLLITHSHEDHTGAIKWLLKEGFSGKVVLSKETYKQMNYKLEHTICLDEQGQHHELEDHLLVEYGRSGHCEGALWYLIKWNGKKVLFSGDYYEHSKIYTCDKLRKKEAELAVLDCAYGLDQMGAIKSKKNLYEEIKHWLAKRKNILLPVPRYGRGLDIMKELLQLKEVSLVAEEDLIQQCRQSNKFSQSEISRIVKYRGEIVEGYHVYLICDPQLKKVENKQFASQIIIRKDKIIFTGHIDKKSYSEMIYNAGAALKKKYYVHQNLQEAKELISKNAFCKVVLAHSGELFEKKDVGERVIPLVTGEKIII